MPAHTCPRLHAAPVCIRRTTSPRPRPTTTSRCTPRCACGPAVGAMPVFAHQHLVRVVSLQPGERHWLGAHHPYLVLSHLPAPIRHPAACPLTAHPAAWLPFPFKFAGGAHGSRRGVVAAKRRGAQRQPPSARQDAANAVPHRSAGGEGGAGRPGWPSWWRVCGQIAVWPCA